MRRFVVPALVLMLGMGGCSPYVNRGETLYREGRYIEAAELFELTEARLKASPSEVCAEYGLYRGLTYLRLDDLRNAHLWLSYASKVERSQPGRLTSDERELLTRAWKELADRTKVQAVARAERARVASTEPEGAATRLGAPITQNGKRSIAAE